MKLSVVIPVYNGAAFIEKSYQSILGQGIDDFELIYVNNNSRDQSVDEILKIQSIDSRVQLLNQPKQGAAAARNMGIRASRGDYVYVFDVDDEIYPDALKALLSALELHPEVMAVFGKMVKSYKGITQTMKPDDETHAIVIKEPPYWGLEWFGSLKTVVGPPAFLYRRAVFDSIGYYNESIRNNEDTALDIKLGLTQCVAFIDRYVYLYFKHEESTIEQAKRRMPRAFMIWPRLIKEHLPFFLARDTPKRFQELLFRQLFLSMGRQIVHTKGLNQRLQLKQQLVQDIQAIKIPWYIQVNLTILIILPLESLRKVYGYYIVPFAVQQLVEKKQFN
ncbi:glycosyltransferase family 2 protein [Hanstruepera flava]|uniref:glycosyltransferase family 2 protein n=1 Tax=Hanstruepera flava TaxID=2930218 RepID=UPI002027F799|nr:glycosyltransferase family 2 protein [Hanstruepera flava]